MDIYYSNNTGLSGDSNFKRTKPFKMKKQQEILEKIGTPSVISIVKHVPA